MVTIRRDDDPLMQELIELTIKAGEQGRPFLEIGCKLIIRASRLSDWEKANLAQAGQLILACFDPSR
jgi:hypothetical protein